MSETNWINVHRLNGLVLYTSSTEKFPKCPSAASEDGYSLMERFSSIEGIEHEVYRRKDEFILYLNLSDMEYEVFYARSVPEYVLLLKDVVRPILETQLHVKG